MLTLSGCKTGYAQFWKRDRVTKDATGLRGKDAASKGEYLFVKGMGHFLQKDYSTAIKYFSEAANLQPKNAGIQFKIADSYLHLHISSKAISYAKKAIELDPTNKHYYLLLAEVYINEHYVEEAAQVFSDMLENVPDNENYYFNLASIQEELGRHELSKLSIYPENGMAGNGKREKEIKEKALLHFQQALKSYDSYEEHLGVSPEISDHKQRIFIAIGEEEKAFEEGRKLIREYPENIDFKIELAELLFQNDRVNQAIELLLNAAEEHPSSPEPRLIASDYYKSINEIEKSEEQLEIAFNNPRMNVDDKVKLISSYLRYTFDEAKQGTALKLAQRTLNAHPDKAQAHSILGDVYNVMGRKEDARDAYLGAIDIDDTRFLIWQQVVALDMDINQQDSVIIHTGQALELFPNKAILWLYQGIAHMVLEDDASAVLSLEEGRKLATHDYAMESQFNANLGDAYNRIEEYEKSDAAYEAALEYDPNNAHVLNNFSYFLSLRDDRLTEALAMSERLILMHPNDPTYLDTYAWVLYKMGNYKKAKKYLEKALLTSEDGTIIEHYGDVLFQLGSKNEAMAQWQKAKDSGGASELIDKKLEDRKLYE